ncbi:precorrin-2 dehydrogenase/sirohydrochlorin ferrochelatase family protein [Paenibacillus taiwanensis]|uniref:precorrin-2 dehydrogenase/sirohydrochlorin ferrochelatase family protein n=1 Tax=Paenibacillus taiwanensis TaxID=401638 RepID=UPI0003F8E2C8|nr:bifunctional precorrin-2 dehydrogenase/sirohydrochlorin ferrochelatase [Paenibacillus taiwanensis]
MNEQLQEAVAAMEDYPQYAIMLNVKHKRCVVVGGGQVATRKVKQLLESGAEVTVVSPTLTRTLWRFVQEGMISVEERGYVTADVKDAFLIFAATDDHEVNVMIAVDAKQERVMVNVAHAPELSDFTNPGVLRYGPVQINVSTGGASPTLTRHIVDKVDRIIDERLGLLAEHLYAARINVQQCRIDLPARHELLRQYGDACWQSWERKAPFPVWSEWLEQHYTRAALSREEAE